MLRLFKSHTLELQLPTKGYYQNGRWVEGVYNKSSLVCGLQAYNKGTTTLVLPEGIKASESRAAYSKKYIELPADDSGKTFPKVLVGNKYFIVYDYEDNNSGLNLAADHYMYLLISEASASSKGL